MSLNASAKVSAKRLYISVVRNVQLDHLVWLDSLVLVAETMGADKFISHTAVWKEFADI
jgi:hypothetical protein